MVLHQLKQLFREYGDLMINSIKNITIYEEKSVVIILVQLNYNFLPATSKKPHSCNCSSRFSS
jgi:hypothetical protein